MNWRNRAAAAATMVALMGAGGTAQAAFEGRLADFTPSATCTPTGAGKCAYFYDTTLDITILNNWNIGRGPWSANAVPGSAQALAASAGFAASGLTGWLLPTGDGDATPGALNQYRSILNSVGSTFAGLQSQFESVQSNLYWSSTPIDQTLVHVFYFSPQGNFNTQALPTNTLYAVAVRPGDVVAAIPEPSSYVLMLTGLGAMTLVMRRRRPR